MASTFRFNFFADPNENVDVEDKSLQKTDNEVACGEVVVSPRKRRACDDKKLTEFQLPGSEKLSVKMVTKPDPIEAGLEIAADKDVITNIYEGGFKLWECARYLLDFLVDQKVSFKDKQIVELGCGAGIPGILTLLFGAKRVVFQDFNKEVLECWTIPNVVANSALGILPSNTQYFYGDWEQLAHLDKFVSPKYDIILMSETIYVESSYSKLKAVIAASLHRPNGVAYLAAKSYYFGTGGSVLEFGKFMQETHPGDPHRFVVANELEINEGVRCAICSIRWDTTTRN